MSESSQGSGGNSSQPSFLSANVASTDLHYDNEPPWFGQRHVEDFFSWAAKTGASDITIQTNERIVLEIYGKNYRVTARKLTNQEVQEIVVGMYKGEGAKAILSGNSDMDFPYQIRPSRDEVFRFRVNATPIYTDGSRGIQITARTIPDRPPELSTLGLEDEIYQNIAPKQGMIVVTGGTGSGKSTLLASIIRHLLEQPEGHRKFLTYESPIEYVYDAVDKPTSTIAQTEVPGHLPSFSAGTRNSLRRKPAVILVGEARDAETIGEAVTASMTGHLLYSTVHSNGFADTIRRMVNVFPETEKNGRAVDIVSSLRMVISQRLVPSTDGKRVALREYVVFNDDVVDLILGAGLDNLTTACREVLRKFGRSFAQDAREKFAQGRITERTLKEVEWGSRAEDADARRELEAQQEKAKQAREIGEQSGLIETASVPAVPGPAEVVAGSQADPVSPSASPAAGEVGSGSSSAPSIPGVLGADEMDHVRDPSQEPRLTLGTPSSES